jgi:dimethylamine monooxygenase subunit A
LILYPFLDPPYRMTMGLLPLAAADWIMFDAAFASDVAEKERLLTERHSEVFAAQPDAVAGSREVLERLAEHLPAQFPDRYRRDGAALIRLHDTRRFDLGASNLHPLDLAGRLVQEDLCLMRRREDGHVLVAASLCFPTRWRLADKLGRPLAPIHAPVPGFDATLGRPVERFFDRLAPGRAVWRANWGIADDPALFQPSGHFRGEHNAAITATNAGDRLWLRVERQTLTRLPQSGDMLFTIRILQEPIARTTAEPSRAGRLAALIRSMPAELKRYKSLPPFEAALLAYLDTAARGAER